MLMQEYYFVRIYNYELTKQAKKISLRK